MPRRRLSVRWRAARAVGVGLVVGGLLGASACSSSLGGQASGDGPAAMPVGSVPPPFPRDLAAYSGQGAWVDVYDYVDTYAGPRPSLTPSAVDSMAERGVRTLFLQTARWDDKTPDGLIDDRLVWSFVQRAHHHGIRVVAWYLPHLGDVERDLDRLRRVRDWGYLGERFDGIGVDIEYTEGEPDVALRNANLIDLSKRFRAETPQMPIGAIVIPAVQLEVVNERYWPDFPYREIAPCYDIWQPMAYWSFRNEPYDDGYLYVKESVDRLRANLGDPAALVAPIGGVADDMLDEHMVEFGQALADVGALGGGMYDWNTLPPGRQRLLADAFLVGPAKDLPAPPPWIPRTVG